MATLYAKTAGGNWSAAGTWSNVNAAGVDNSGPPTAADDVIFELLSGNVTIDAASVCRSLDTTSGTGTYGGVLTHNSAITLTIGDATAGAGNVALKLNSGMTFTLGSPSTSAISFVSTSGTTQTITTAGKTTGSVTLNGIGGSWQLADAHTIAAAATVTLSNGTFDLNGNACSWGTFISNTSTARTLTPGAAAITMTAGGGAAWQSSVVTNLTITANTSTVTLTAAGALWNSATMNFNGMSVVFSGSGVCGFNNTGVCTFANITRTGTAAKTDSFYIAANQTATGTFTCTGNSATNRMLVQSSTVGTARTITAAAVTLSNADFTDITAAGAASPFTGTSLGNALGNSNITFTTPVTRYWVGNGGSWSSTTKWSTSSGGSSGASVPLCHDTVNIDANSITSASQTISADMLRIGADINFAGVLNSPVFSNASPTATLYIFGSITMGSGMTVGGSSSIAPMGRSSHTITSAGVIFPQNFYMHLGYLGTYSLGDAFSCLALLTTNVTFTTNNYNVTISYLTSITGGDTLNMGSSTFALTSTVAGYVWISPTTVNAGTSTIVISSASASARIFGGTYFGSSHTYNVLTYTVAGSTGQLTFVGSSTFNTINFSDAMNARTLTFTSSTTTTITTAFNVNGTAGKLMTINSSTSSSAATLNRPTSGYFSCDYLSIKDSTATGGAGWFAGANSTNVSGNTGWVFAAPPTRVGDFMPFFS